MRMLVATTLRRGGWDVLEAGDGMDLLDCVAWLIESRDDWAESVLVSDIRMPELGGLEVLARLRGLGWTGGIILITAFGDEATHTRAHELGATMIDKPFDSTRCASDPAGARVMIERHTPWIRASCRGAESGRHRARRAADALPHADHRRGRPRSGTGHHGAARRSLANRRRWSRRCVAASRSSPLAGFTSPFAPGDGRTPSA